MLYMYIKKFVRFGTIFKYTVVMLCMKRYHYKQSITNCPNKLKYHEPVS